MAVRRKTRLRFCEVEAVERLVLGVAGDARLGAAVHELADLVAVGREGDPAVLVHHADHLDAGLPADVLHDEVGVAATVLEHRAVERVADGVAEEVRLGDHLRRAGGAAPRSPRRRTRRPSRARRRRSCARSFVESRWCHGIARPISSSEPGAMSRASRARTESSLPATAGARLLAGVGPAGLPLPGFVAAVAIAPLPAANAHAARAPYARWRGGRCRVSITVAFTARIIAPDERGCDDPAQRACASAQACACAQGGALCVPLRRGRLRRGAGAAPGGVSHPVDPGDPAYPLRPDDRSARHPPRPVPRPPRHRRRHLELPVPARREHHRLRPAHLGRRRGRLLHAPRVPDRAARPAARGPRSRRSRSTWRARSRWTGGSRSPPTRKRVAVLVSKHDHALLELLWTWKRGDLRADVTTVVSNHPDLRDGGRDVRRPVRPRAEHRRTRARPAEARMSELLDGKVDLVVLARYMQIVSPGVRRALAAPDHQHPPLLPPGVRRRRSVPAGLRARREDRRGDRPLRHRRARRGARSSTRTSRACRTATRWTT